MDTKGNVRKRKSVEKPLCKYGGTCYQKNQEHRKKFKHPPKDKKLNENSFSDAPDGVPSEESMSDTSSNTEPDTVSDVTQNDHKDMQCEETVGEVLKKMPKDFFDFWDFCTVLNSLSPQDAFSDFGYKLVGVYDLLAKKLPTDQKVDISCHWRYFYDPPEFQTVLRKDGKALYHIGYFRDDPSEMPSILASNSAAVDGKLVLMGDNIFCAMNVELNKIVETSSSEATKGKARKLQEKLLKYASRCKYSTDLQTRKTKERQKKVVSKTFNGLGIVVPVINDVGYRPLPDSNATLKKMLNRICSAQTENKRLEEEESLDEIISNVHFANDECDYGMGLELGIDLFCYGDTSLHKTIEGLLTIAYNLLNRSKYSSVIKAHLKQREKGIILKSPDI